MKSSPDSRSENLGTLDTGEFAATLAGDGEPVAEGTQLWTLLLSDLVGSTRLVEKLGDNASAGLFALHDRLARDLLKEHGGREIDKTDGFLLLFHRPWEAVRYALEYHRGLADLGLSEEADLVARVGIHFGEVVLRLNPPEDVARGAKPLEVEGLAKPTAARLMSLAGARQTLLTRSAFDLARRSAVGESHAKGELRWLAHGGYLFKGVDEPFKVFEVGAEGVAPLRAPEGSEKAVRVLSDDTILGWRPAPGLAIPHRANWVVEKKLNEGGFGEVWLAGNRRLHDHRVFKFCYETEQLRSLQREITVFRLLKEELGDREDIARIFDWNLDEAPYFIESAYTEGGSLLDWAEGRGGIGRVPLAERLEVVAQVATALTAAHSVGVLHKDIKPANVLITEGTAGRPQAVLTDFGIGLITDVERLAARGITVVGLTEMEVTPESPSSGGTHLYMAPELFSGQASTIQADIYSLGVMLYQVAVGDLERPLAPGWRRQVDDELLREDIARFVDGSPQRRPSSAAEVAEALRSLESRRASKEAERRAREEAEEAERKTRAAAAKARRRRKLLTTVAALSTVFLIIVTILAVRTHRARQDAQRGRAQAEQLIDFMLGDLHDSLERIGRLDLLAEVARGARKYFGSLSERDESADATYKRGLTLLNVGDVLLDQGDAEAANASYRSAVALFEAAAAAEPSRDAWREGLILSWVRLGKVLSRQGETSAALETLRTALEAAEAMSAQDPQNPDHRYQLALAGLRMAEVEKTAGNMEVALEGFRATVELLEAAQGEAGWRHSELLLRAWVSVGVTLRIRDEPEAALEAFGKSRQMAKRLIEGDPSTAVWQRELARIHFQIGAIQLFSQHDLPAALEAFQSAVTAYRGLVAADPTRVRWRAQLAESLRMVGVARSRAGEPDAALENYPESLQIMEELVAQDPTRQTRLLSLSALHASISSAHLLLGNPEAALEASISSCDLRQQVVEASGDDPWPGNLLSIGLVKLGDIYTQLGEADKARHEWSRALALIEPITARSELISYRDTQVHVLLRLGLLDEAKPVVESLLSNGWEDPEFLQKVRESGLKIP